MTDKPPSELSEAEGLDDCYQRLRELNGRGVEVYVSLLVPRVIAMLDAFFSAAA